MLVFYTLTCSLYASASGSNDRLFGFEQTAYSDLQPFPQLADAISRFKMQRSAHVNCMKLGTAPCSLSPWFSILDSLRTLTREQQLAQLNSRINKYPYKTDKYNYASDDYWATPLDLLTNGGDCEDYAVTKMLALQHLGFPASSMRIVVLQDTLSRNPHAVLAVQNGRNTLILDNRSNDIRSDHELKNYAPLYSINERQWWLHVPFEVAQRHFVQVD
ncbi:MAG: transglutaminase-like cysteine peptidase [Pseudomonadales bacterium]